MARQQNINAAAQYFTGEDKALVFTIYQSDEVTAQNITGWTLSWMVKAARTDEDSAALLTKTTASGITLTTPLSGICTVTITDDDLNDSDLEAGTTYHHELKRTNDGFETVLAYGTFLLNQAVHA
jgi:hypothetical protein